VACLAETAAARANSKYENKARKQGNIATSQMKLGKAEIARGTTSYDLGF
jgi:hypothetical protein